MSTNQATYQDRKLKMVRMVQFVVYCWALRLAFVAAGSILVSLFQFIIPSTGLGMSLQHIKVFSWSTIVKDDYKYMRELSDPVLFRSLDVIAHSLLKTRILRVTPIAEMKLKVSNSDAFTHFDESRLWAKRYSSRKTYTYIAGQDLLQDRQLYRTPEILQSPPITDSVIPSVCDNTNIDSVCSNMNIKVSTHETLKPYIYGTHSNALSYVPALSPSLAQLISLEPTTPQVCLWLSSPNITAALHYDLEDNLLLQISGTKKVIIVSPEALDRFSPHSSWHPHWRQVSTGPILRTNKEIIEYLTSVEEVRRTASLNDTGIRTNADNDANTATCVHSDSSTSTHRGTATHGGAYGEYRIWEVDLSPGQMVHIPAGYYHTVTAGDNSISVNAWFRSVLSDVHTLFTNVPLPFTSKDSQSVKLTRLAVTVRQLLYKMQMSADLFARTMSARYTVLLQYPAEGGWDTVRDHGNEMCVRSEVLAAGMMPSFTFL